jgi:hypothetical protein
MDEIEWRGPQDGLPPVGTEVEYNESFTESCRWIKGVIACHLKARDGTAVVVVQYHNGGYIATPLGERLRPLQSERDKAIKDLAWEINQAKDKGAWQSDVLAEHLIDKGYGKGDSQ